METKMQWQKLGKKDVTLSTIAKQRNAATGLLKAIDGFIAQEQWQSNKLEFVRLKLKGYKELKLDDKFEEGFNEQMSFLENEPEQDIDTFYEKHMLVELSMQGVVARSNRTLGNDIRPVIKTLDEYHALKKVRYLCEAISRQLVLGVDYAPENTAFILKTLEPYSNPGYPYVYLFLNVFGMISCKDFEKSLSYYYVLKEGIQNLAETTVSQSVKEAVDYIASYCVRWYNKGYGQAANEYLFWIEWKDKNNLLLVGNILMPVTFRNVVRMAVLGDKDTKWIESWINDKIRYVLKEHYDTNHAYAMGLYEYSKKNYLEAIRFLLLAQMKDDVFFNCNLRLWQWMCLYEYDKEDVDALYANLQAFEKYIARNKKLVKHRPRMFELFISYAFQIVKSAEHDSSNLLRQINKEEYFAGKPWLINCIKQKLEKPVSSDTG